MTAFTDPGEVLRRAPFSDNPRVGVRGQRAQRRILDAAVQVFGEDGYHQCGVLRITEVAGCSRAAFYQYFTSKEDVFRHLAGEVARQLTASAEALRPITPDADGWATLRDWVARHGEIFDRYEPVFRVFQAAAESDEAVATGAARTLDRSIAGIAGKLTISRIPNRHLNDVIALLLAAMSRTHHDAAVMQSALGPAAYARSRVDDALTDIAHRTLTGIDPDVNVHPPLQRRPPRVKLGPLMLEGLDTLASDRSATGARTRKALLEAGHAVLVAKGYHGTRVDDITEAAGVSHGAFYRYFDNKEHIIRHLAVQAMRTVSESLAAIPASAAELGPSGATALRQWLRRYNTTHASETAMIRVWVDATKDDPALHHESAAALDWGRTRMVHFLERRGFGDVDTEALVLVALLDAFGDRSRSTAAVQAAAHIIERGFLGAV